MTCANIQTVNKKNGKLPANLAKETTQEKLCVDIIGSYIICIKGKETLILKFVTMIDPVTGWFEVTIDNYKKAMMIVSLVETKWIFRYPWPVEITYD